MLNMSEFSCHWDLKCLNCTETYACLTNVWQNLLVTSILFALDNDHLKYLIIVLSMFYLFIEKIAFKLCYVREYFIFVISIKKHIPIKFKLSDILFTVAGLLSATLHQLSILSRCVYFGWGNANIGLCISCLLFGFLTNQ